MNVIISRIRKCNSIHLAVENKSKMQQFLKIIIENFFHLCDNDSSEDYYGKVNGHFYLTFPILSF